MRKSLLVILLITLISIPIKAQKGLTDLKEFTSTTIITVPGNIDHILVEMWGAGGGGGGGGNSTGTAVGGGGSGGGGGAYIRSVIAVIPGQKIQVIIGAGGAAGAPNSIGTDGGDSRIVQNGQILTFAGGGKGGLSGKQDVGIIPNCNFSSFIIAGSKGGTADIRAGIKRDGRDGGSGFPFNNVCFPNGLPGGDCIAQNSGFGGGGGTTTIGTITPPGSIGGIGGRGHTPAVSGCGANSGDGPSQPGEAGSKGYAIITY